MVNDIFEKFLRGLNEMVLAKAVTYLLEWNPALKQILEHLKKAV